ncbi:hypothetical protein EJ110_NYTH55046, partial [Nymphaea thermarum]
MSPRYAILARVSVPVRRYGDTGTAVRSGTFGSGSGSEPDPNQYHIQNVKRNASMASSSKGKGTTSTPTSSSCASKASLQLQEDQPLWGYVEKKGKAPGGGGN